MKMWWCTHYSSKFPLFPLPSYGKFGLNVCLSKQACAFLEGRIAFFRFVFTDFRGLVFLLWLVAGTLEMLGGGLCSYVKCVAQTVPSCKRNKIDSCGCGGTEICKNHWEIWFSPFYSRKMYSWQHPREWMKIIPAFKFKHHTSSSHNRVKVQPIMVEHYNILERSKVVLSKRCCLN